MNPIIKPGTWDGCAAPTEDDRRKEYEARREARCRDSEDLIRRQAIGIQCKREWLRRWGIDEARAA